MRISGYYDLGGRKAPKSRINVSAGDDRDILIRCLDDDGAVVDITGATPIAFDVSRKAGASLDISKDLSSGISITDAANGEFTVSLAPSDTQDLTNNYIYSAQLTLSGKLRTVVSGAFVILDNASND